MSMLSRSLKAARCPYAAAVIVAGGASARFGSDKLMVALGGVPVLARSLLAFQASPMIREIVVAARQDAMPKAAALCEEYGISKAEVVVPGGETRLLSSLAGVMAVSERAELIAIHDGARPLVGDKVIENALWGAYRHGAAVPAVPVTDTIKRARNGVAVETPERKSLFAVQTPQCFQADVIRAALLEAAKSPGELTDDCMAVEAMGGAVYLTEGSEENLKLTTPLDLALAELILQRREAP